MRDECSILGSCSLDLCDFNANKLNPATRVEKDSKKGFPNSGRDVYVISWWGGIQAQQSNNASVTLNWKLIRASRALRAGHTIYTRETMSQEVRMAKSLPAWNRQQMQLGDGNLQFIFMTLLNSWVLSCRGGVNFYIVCQLEGSARSWLAACPNRRIRMESSDEINK